MVPDGFSWYFSESNQFLLKNSSFYYAKNKSFDTSVHSYHHIATEARSHRAGMVNVRIPCQETKARDITVKSEVFSNSQ